MHTILFHVVIELRDSCLSACLAAFGHSIAVKTLTRLHYHVLPPSGTPSPRRHFLVCIVLFCSLPIAAKTFHMHCKRTPCHDYVSCMPPSGTPSPQGILSAGTLGAMLPISSSEGEEVDASRDIANPVAVLNFHQRALGDRIKKLECMRERIRLLEQDLRVGSASTEPGVSCLHGLPTGAQHPALPFEEHLSEILVLCYTLTILLLTVLG